MNELIDRFATVVTSRPHITLIVLLVTALGLAAGSGLLTEQADNSVFLPDDSEVAEATGTLSEAFPDSAGLTNVTIIHRGDVLTPEGLAQIDAVAIAATADPEVAERLALSNPVISIADVYKQALLTSDLSTVSQAQIDQVTLMLADHPEFGPILDSLVGEADGQSLAISSIRLRSLGDDDGLAAAELEIADIVRSVDGPLDVRSLSSETINQESAESSSSSMTVLMFVAFAVIIVLLFLFFRTGSDVLLSLVGLGITVVGTLGFQGIMGPGGLGLIGSPNRITTMVPILLIGLVVDYSIQSVARYREMRGEGLGVAEAARGGLRVVVLPLGLAAGTTIISFLTNIVSPIPATRDFGIVAAFGVFFGLLVVLILVPAARSILDGRRQAKGTLRTPRPIADAIPGVGPMVERIGGFVARKPAVVLAGTAIVTIVLGAAAFNITTVFDSNDFLPSGGDSVTDLEALGEAFGGQTETVTVLVEAELTDDRTLRNLVEINRAFADDLSRPTGATGDITASLGTLFSDWVDDSGQPGDKYDSELVAIAEEVDQGLTLDPVGLQALYDRLELLDPVGFAQVAVDDPNGTDLALIQFNGFTGDQERTRQMVEDIEGLWYGDRDQITVTSGDIISLEVTDAMIETQTASIVITVVAALIVLMLFFWATESSPMLAVIAVFPIVLVLLWVLGSMTLLGIPYNVVTALITALSIGIGVDYTIHVIHRFTEELEHGWSIQAATTTTLSTTGSALVGSALTTVLGFGVLLFSPLVPFRQFGLVTAITILFALIVAVAVVPPLLVIWAAYHEWRRREMPDLVGAAPGDVDELLETKARNPRKRDALGASVIDSVPPAKSYTVQAERYESKAADETKEAAEARKKLSDVSKSISTTAKTLRSAEESVQRSLDIKDKARRREELAHARELRRMSMPQIAYMPVREPEPETLRVLYLTANPEATETVITLPDGSQSREGTWLRTEREVRSVQKAIRGSKYRDLIEIHHMPAATPGDVLKEINAHRPHVIHFSGHAGGEALLMDDEDDDSFQRTVLEFDILAEALAATITPPSLIVLNRCETLDGAEILLNATPVVIAMSNSISDAAATIFATQFYAAIASAQSVDAALAQGKVALRMGVLDEDLTPQYIAREDFDIKTQVLVSAPS